MENANYSLITIAPLNSRLDRIVVGLVVFNETGATVKFTEEFGKIRSINPNYRTEALYALQERIATLANGCESIEQLRLVMKVIGTSVQLSQFEGIFGYRDTEEYGRQLKNIMDESVNSPRKIERTRNRKTSKLRASLQKQFSRMGILGENVKDIDHKVVHRYPIREDQGLYADFALKNTYMHVTATVDFTLSEQAYTAKRYETQAKCLVLRAAEEICGADTKKYVVIAGGHGKNSAAAINLLRANATVFRFENSDEMDTYLSQIERAAKGNSPLQ